MKTTAIEKGMVQKMREIRDSLNVEIMNMTFEEEKTYIKSQIEKLKSKNIKK